MRRVVFSADDFGLSVAVNEAVERAHREGVLQAASLMVAGPAAADAVRRARAMPSLRVGLHLVAVEGPAVLPAAEIPDLVDAHGWFGSDQVRRGVRYAFSGRARAQLAREIDAQYAAFAATGLVLDHANAHKHMHLHPVVGRLLIGVGRDYGLRAIRVPSEPPAVLAACGARISLGDRALFAWSGWLRRAARRAGLRTTDHCFGIKWTGAMHARRLIALAGHLPQGESEIYLHPAAGQDALLQRAMPSYRQEEELAALLDPAVRAAYAAATNAFSGAPAVP